MSRSIHRITAVRLYFIPVQTRVPLKFGSETLTSATCARAAVTVVDEQGRQAEGWGETPLSVQWVWPSSSPYEQRHAAMKRLCCRLASAWMEFKHAGHPLEIGVAFQERVLRPMLLEFNQLESASSRALDANAVQTGVEARVHDANFPWLAALVCNSPFDLALHDAFGQLLDRSTYRTYGPDCLSTDLARFLEPAENARISFLGKYPVDYLDARPPDQLRAWHLVGGLDLLEPGDLRGDEPQDGYPILLTEWIKRDGLKCLKVKLRGNDQDRDAQRLIRVGQIALAHDVECLSADFNCTVHEPAYVNEILDRLSVDYPEVFARLLYVEQPFPYDLEQHRIDVHSVSARKPLFLDESAHDWKMVRLGRELGWTGVALKTCKTQTGAVLSACWAKTHGMSLMVQDLTNPMLAQIPHVLLAAHVGTIMGVETNAMQFYPEVSAPEAKVHPGLYQRRNGTLDLSSIGGSGFGYRLQEIQRTLPEPAFALALS
jgi:L-alanine-DL-glutamate epimerase-like enolase superfamily enzyme